MVTQPIFNRPPVGPYFAQPNLTNTNKYQSAAAQGISISSQDVDGDINYCVDGLNALYAQLIGVTAGVIPGANSPGNIFKFPTTNGFGEITWQQVTSAYVANNGITIDKLQAATPGSLISWTFNNQPVLVAPGLSGYILQSNGPTAPPSFIQAPFLNKNGDKMLGYLGLYTTYAPDTINQFQNGTGDGASYGAYNVGLKMNYGLGFSNNDDVTVGYIDFRLGKISMAGGYWTKDADGVDTEGVILPATVNEMRTGTATNRLVTPANISAGPAAAKGHLIINGVTGAIINSSGGSWVFNRVNTGNYTITMPWTFGSATDYVIQATPTGNIGPVLVNPDVQTTNGFTLSVHLQNGSTGDAKLLYITIFDLTAPV